MRWRRALYKLRWYLQEYTWRGVFYFAQEMAIRRLINLAALYRTLRWRRLVRRLTPDELRVNVQGLQLYLNPSDLGLSAELAVEGVHEPMLTTVLRSVLRRGWTVVDVGANLGYFALLAAKQVGPEGKVIALEPFPDSYRLLTRNIEVNKLANVLALPLAAGERKEERAFYCYERANWNGFRIGDRPPIGQIRVTVRPLDDLLEREPRVDLIRMDVEGAELEVLRGAAETLKKHRPVLAMEVHARYLQESEFKELIDRVEGLGYTIEMWWERWREEMPWRRWSSGECQTEGSGPKRWPNYSRLKTADWAVTVLAWGRNEG